MKHTHILRYRLFALIVVLSVTLSAKAQFCHLFDSDYDLPNSLVNDVVEDTNSMIWVGTEDGLFRYDGSKFSAYKQDLSNQHALQDSYIRCLFVDKEGHLLVGSRAGLQVYRPDTDDFSEVASFSDGRPSPGDVAHIYQRSDGEIWMTGNATVSLQFKEDGTPILCPNAFTHVIDMTEGITEDMDGRIWVTKSVSDMYRLEISGDIFHIRYDNPDHAFFNIFTAADGRMYAGGQKQGLYRYNRETDAFELLGNEEDACYQVRDMCNLSREEMLVGTDNMGLKIYNFKDETFRTFLFDNGRIDPLTQKVHSVCLDNENSIWLGMYQKGLMIIPYDQQAFKYLGYNSYHYNCIGDKCVTSIVQGTNDVFWVATDNDGLYGVTREGDQLRHFPYTGKPGTLPSSLLSLYKDSKNRYWYGSYTQGFGLIDINTGKCTDVTINGKLVRNSSFYNYEEDHKNRVWGATMGMGIFIYDEVQKTMVTAVDASYCLWTNDIHFDPARHWMYAGTHNGLAIIDVDNPDYPSENFLQDYIIFAINDYSVNTLCACTNHGLVLFDINTHDYTVYDESKGMPSDVVYSCQVDANSNIWACGNAGLCCIDPKRGTITTFTASDGIQSNEFYKNATLKEENGNLWFGGVAGITWFDPTKISFDGKKCKARIVDFVVSGRSYHSGYELDYQDNSPAIEMGTLPIMSTRRATYRYSLDKEAWITLPQGQNHVTFSHLSPGKHVFDFVAVVNGIESDVERLTFYIAFPWYLQWWSQLLWFGLLMLALWMLYSHLNQRRKTRDSLMQHEQAQAINEAKLEFFMNISHEIRTPMTMIVSPLQKLIKTDSDVTRQRSYELIQRNANRILSLINQLMDLRKIDKNQMQMLFSEVDIVPFIRNICETVNDVADIRGIRTSLIDETGPGLKLWIDMTNFDKILINLLSNSLKYTPNGGSIEVKLQETVGNEQMPDGVFIMTVTDTGVGIPESERSHIFDRFYQVRGNNINGGGTGIGLNLTHSLVTLHHGTIELHDNPSGTGTSFVICLPLGNRHLKMEEMSQEIPSVTPIVKQEPAELFIEPAVTEQEEESAVTPNSKKQLMIVEDDKEIRNYIMQEMRKDYHIIECQDGQQALDIIMSQAPDIIISDLMMPNMDGMTLCGKVRQNIRLNHIPFIMLTAKTQEEDRIAGLEVGADAYITKPFNMEVLRKTIKNLLQSHDRLRNTFSGQQLPSDQIDTPESKSPDERLLERVIKVVNAHLNDPGLTTDLIAKEVGLSRVHLYRKLKELTNQSARDYVRNIRLTKAAELLSSKKMAVSEVANLVGFSNANNFATSFRELFGVTPTQYMEQHIEKKE